MSSPLSCELGWNAGFKQIAFFVVPSAVAFLFLGDVITGALYNRVSLPGA